MKIKLQINQMWILIPVVLYLFTDQVHTQSIIFKSRLLNDNPINLLANASNSSVESSKRLDNIANNITVPLLNLESNKASLNESSINAKNDLNRQSNFSINQTSTLGNSELNYVKNLTATNSPDSKIVTANNETLSEDLNLSNRLVKTNSTSLFINKNVTANSTDILNKEKVKQTGNSVENLPGESSTIDETKLLDNRSTNEDDEFEDFESEGKKEDESSIIEHDKGNNLLENNNQLNKVINDGKLKDNESTSKAINKEENEEEDESGNSYTANRPTNPQTSLNSSEKNESVNGLANDLEHEDDEENDEDEEEINHKKSSDQSNDKAARRKKVFGEKERKSLLKLQTFVLGLVEQGLKSSLPELLKVGYETNVSTTCTNSFLAVTRGLQATKQWAYKSK